MFRPGLGKADFQKSEKSLIGLAGSNIEGKGVQKKTG